MDSGYCLMCCGHRQAMYDLCFGRHGVAYRGCPGVIIPVVVVVYSLLYVVIVVDVVCCDVGILSMLVPLYCLLSSLSVMLTQPTPTLVAGTRGGVID